MRNAEATQAREKQEKERVMSLAKVAERVHKWAARKNLPQMLNSVHELLPNLVPVDTVANAGGSSGGAGKRVSFVCRFDVCMRTDPSACTQRSLVAVLNRYDDNIFPYCEKFTQTNSRVRPTQTQGCRWWRNCWRRRWLRCSHRNTTSSLDDM